MPNTILKPTVIVATALGLLQRQIVLPGLVWTDAQGNSPLGANDTFSIRVPATLAARRRSLRGTGGARTITMDTITESKVDVTLTEDIYQAVPITDEELTLDIVDFGLQILTPQIRAVAEGLENDLALLMQGATYAHSVITVDPAATYSAIVDARKALNDSNVPMAGRAIVVGSGIEAAILKDPQFSYADRAGDSTALRDAKIGTVAGFDVYTSNALGSDEGYAFHKTAYVMAMRAPVVPQGATFGQSQSFQGLAMRWLKDYDFQNVQDRSLVDTFSGYAVVPDIVNGSPSFVRSVKLELLSATITATPTTKTLAVAATQQLVIKDATGATLPSGDVAFTSSDVTKATVSTGGLVTAVATGSATITATYQGHTATCAVTVS